MNEMDCLWAGGNGPATVMGILNVTPDSFSDGGRYFELDAALAAARDMAAQGAGIIDVGGESTRPGAEGVDLDEELGRIIPVVRALTSQLEVPVSIDTSKPDVMMAAVEAGAAMINDVQALRSPGAIEAAAACRVPVCLMHMQGRPRTMQSAPAYDDVVEDVYRFLAERVEAAVAGGVAEEDIVVDPGFGFGKTVEHNLSLVRHLGRFLGLGRPLLVGVSRKSMLGTVLDRPVEARLAGGLAIAALAADAGASIIRVHDVAPTVDVVRMVAAVKAAE
jgi:dihydropteroate synthase